MTACPTLELRIIPAAEIDLAATVEVVNAAFRVHTILTEDRTSLEGIVEELWPGCRFVQVFDGPELVGSASITPGASAPVDQHEFPGIEIPRSLYFGLAAVSPSHMGDGIGGRLLAETERIARSEGFDHVILTTIEEMGNVAYYERFGYRTVSVEHLPVGNWSLTIPTHYHGMVKDLPGANVRVARLDESAEIAALVNLAYEVERFFVVGPRTNTEEVARLIENHAFGPEVRQAIADHHAVYCIAVGGTGALLNRHIKSATVVAFEDLGPEAIRRLEVEGFPAIVVNDCRGNDLPEAGKAQYRTSARPIPAVKSLGG